MEALLYFALWTGLFFIMMRYGCGAHVLGKGHGAHRSSRDRANDGSPERRWMPPQSDVDPVCGMNVETASAKSSVHDGNVYYFCSRECREAFEAAPTQYTGSEARSTSAPRRMEHDHV